MGGVAPPKPPRCYNILSVTVKPEEENIEKGRFVKKVDGNSVESGVKINESCWNENTCRVNFNKYRLAKGCSRLMYACQQGLMDTVVRELRNKPESIRQRDSSNKSALHYCSGQRNLLAAASVAVAAPDLLESADEDGFTPLHLAVIQGNLAMVNLLLANKADVNAVDNEGHSVVHWATVCGEVEALRSVLQAGANVKIPDINGGTPLHYAAQMCGANYDNKLGQSTSSKLALEILNILLAHPQSSVDITDKDGRKPLLWAASAGSAKAVLALVKAGSRIESADKDGLTALHCASSRGHTECIDTIISLCGAQTDLIDSNGCTALHYAVTLGHADATSRLLDLDADPNRQDRKGRTPAHCGCSKGQLETVKLLKEWGANLWLRNAKGDVPVHEAALSGRRELVEWLLEQKPKHVNTTSNDGRSLMHIAASNDYTDICKLLLDYGANVNSILRNSKSVAITPLDCALQKGFRSTAKFLQSNGGLPASKLRLSARRLNAFSDQDLVKPLKYVEKEDLHNLKCTKRNVIYSKRSDSDSGEQCSCNEHTYKKEHTYSHTCRHHNKRLRRRTSSCGESKQFCGEDSCSDICRSKSNIEIRRRRSRERVSTSESDFDSCENCCYHKKKHKLKRRERITRKPKVLRGGNNEVEDKNDTDVEKFKLTREKKTIPADTIIGNPMELHTSGAPCKISNVHKSRPISNTYKKLDKVTGNLISNEKSVPLSFTDEEVSPDKAEQVVLTQADVHVPAVEENSQAEKQVTDLEAENLELKQEQAIRLEKDNEVNSKEVIQNDETPSTVIKSTQDDETISTNTDRPDAAYDADGDFQKHVENEQIPIIMETEIVEHTEHANECTSLDTEKKEEELCIISPDLVSGGNKNEGIIPTGIEIISELQNTEEISKELIHKTEIKGNLNASELLTEETKVVLLEEDLAEKQFTTDTDVLKPNIEENYEPSNENLDSAMHLTNSREETKSNETSELADKSQDIQPNQTTQPAIATQSSQPIQQIQSVPSSPATAKNTAQDVRDQESRRSFTLLLDSPDYLESQSRKSSFQILKSDESVDVDDVIDHFKKSHTKPFKIVDGALRFEADSEGNAVDNINDENIVTNLSNRTSNMLTSHSAAASTRGAYQEYNNGRKRRLKKRIKSGGTRGRSYYKMTSKVTNPQIQQSLSNKDHDSGFEPSPRATKTKIPTPRNMYTAHLPRKAIYATLDGRLCSGRIENRRPGDKGACDMSAVTRSIQRNIRRYYMERKIFQHLLELKSLQIRSNKLNEAVLVKRAVDEYHKSCIALGGETGTTLRRYSYSEYTFKNFELFLYETLKTLQRPGTFNFQNINDVYEEAERRLSPDYNAYEKALQCTTKTHRCLHATHAYTGIPCAAYIPMMNHHTMPKFGFGPYKKSGAGSFYLPKILSSNPSCGSKVSLELSHGKNKQLISLPSEKLDSNKRYYVTFTVKESDGKQQLQQHPPQQLQQQGSTASCGDNTEVSEKTCDQKKAKEDRDDK